MYDSDNPLVKGKNPTIRFDNKNTLSTNRLQLVTETPDGDVNADGKFNVSDVVLLQKWLLAVPDARLANWREGDFCVDNRLDGFDLCLMKQELLKK
ncbi:MAG: dockerin type I repeat-containing protein [Oscillospiraceae bacterium]|nr:dockerin type I repeat-containing protein [Oscillospiraceae bacterium]